MDAWFAADRSFANVISPDDKVGAAVFSGLDDFRVQ
jgi:hypothetical protein